MNPSEIYTQLESDNLFQDWRKQHRAAYPSHFFASLDVNHSLKGNWEIGLFSADTKKITVFARTEKGFAIKPEDDVFSKETPKVEELTLDNITIPFEKASAIHQENATTFFSNQQLGDGFVVLQMIEQKRVWNFTSISKTLQFCNLKINADTGEIVSHEIIDVVQRD